MAGNTRTRRQRAQQERKAGPGAGEGFWDRLSGPAKHGICALALLVVSLGFFAPIHFSGKSLIGGDTVGWRAMAESVLQYQEETGVAALWVTNAFGGMPAYTVSYETEVPQLDAVTGLLRRVIWPTSHMFVLLLGTYFLVYFLVRDRLAGVLAACAFGLTAYLPEILLAGHNSKFVTLAFMPWLVLAFAYTLRKPSLLGGLLFAITLALNLRAGHVQMTYYAAFLLGIWWIVEGIGAARHGRAKTFGWSTAYLALGSVLGVLMVAQPYLSMMEYKGYTIRGAATGGEAGGLDWSYAMQWSQGIGELITLLVANAFGGGGQLYWGPKPFTAGPHYVGGIVILLAILALWRTRSNVVRAFGIGVLLMILFSLGEHFPALNRFMYLYFPLFDAFRVPETWLAIVAFALAVLAGFGLYEAVRRTGTPAEERRRDRAVYATAGCVAAVAFLLYVAPDVFFDFQKPNEVEMLRPQVAQQLGVAEGDPRVDRVTRQVIAEQFVGPRQEALRSDALRTLLFVLAAGLLLFAYHRGKLPAWGVQAAIALLVVLDLGGVGRRYINEDVLVDAERADEQIPSYDFDQYLTERREEAGGPGTFRVLSLESRSPFTNARPSFYHESIGGYNGAKLRIFQDYIDHLFVDPQSGLPNENALDILNTRYIVAPGQLPGTEVVFQGQQALVLENPDAVPRAFFVGEVEVIEEPEAVWTRIQSESFEPRRTAILSEPIDFEVTPIGEGSSTSVELRSYSAREIAWQVTTDAPRLLVVSEIYYPAGWEATLDGEPVPIYQADYLLRAVPVPAGTHELVFRFDPESHTASLWVSWIATVLAYGLTVVLLGAAWRSRQWKQEREDRGSAEIS